MERFSAKVITLLERRDESQAKLARAIDVDPSQLTKWLKGKGRPSVEQLLAIARYLGVTLDYLADDQAEEPRDDRSEDEDERHVLRVYRSLRRKGVSLEEVEDSLIGLGEPGEKARERSYGTLPTVAVRDESEAGRRDEAEKRKRLGFELEADREGSGPNDIPSVGRK